MNKRTGSYHLVRVLEGMVLLPCFDFVCPLVGEFFVDRLREDLKKPLLLDVLV